ncbi:hypothetical protein V495_06408 [Pseudogymnoascus sp. VKM F-4514 (FW-929)]|nr:hypothetical protein V495_06408 [Pseudogymnoascus sp. VKM F-4514 (FW-929)]KFY54901.1 hypothetical protein V497_07376 [Pseudogymnoascus sp. VKM F-4516 (FW-969)]
MATQAIDQGKAADGAVSLCKRCSKNEATTNIRSEPVCLQCFTYYVNTKAIKRLETYKDRNRKSEAKRYLLPLSFGASSTSLLYILDEQLRKQSERMGRTSYELIVVHVDLEFEDAAASEKNSLVWKAVQDRFPKHTYVEVSIADALDIKSIDWLSLGLTVDEQLPPKDRLANLLKSISTATSRSDIASTLLTRLLVSVAEKNSCGSILFGDSTTRLAEKTLTETAKGRGFSLPWQVSDGTSPFGDNLSFNYPMRDLLKKELVAFTQLTSPPLSDIVIPVNTKSALSASSKSTTIDDLMTQYFESVEENYPSIVANVVRTSSKLKTPEVNDGTECTLCGIPVAEGTDGIDGWSGEQSSSAAQPVKEVNGQRPILCYGCARSING